MVAVAGATFIAANVVVIVPFRNRILGLGHYLGHWPELPRGRRHRGRAVEGMSPTERGAAADKPQGGGGGESGSHGGRGEIGEMENWGRIKMQGRKMDWCRGVGA